MKHKVRRRAGVLSALPCVAIFLIMACGGGGGSGGSETSVSPPPEPTNPPPPMPEVVTGFTDVTSDSGIGFEFGYVRPLSDVEVADTAPSGVAAGDYDSDGLIDLAIVRGDVGPNLLYRNLGDLRFEEVGEESGIAWSLRPGENLRHGSPGLADLDGDGDLDLFLPGMGFDPARLYRNEGDGRFTDVTAGSGVDLIQAEFSFSPAFGDYDLDGDLDMLLAHWGTLRDRSNRSLETEHLWRNDSDEVGMLFTPVTLESGLAPDILDPNDPLITQHSDDYTFSPTFARINGDRHPDVLMVADFNHTQVFHNGQDGSFVNVTDVDVIIDGNGMGSALGDYDFDGDLDWFVSSILGRGEGIPPQISDIGNRLYLNQDGLFVDVTEGMGVADGGWGWGSCFMDFENDGDLDIYHTNGWPDADQYGQFSTDRSRAFVSENGTGFEDMARDLGLDDPYEGRGVVCADFDNDGDTDILQLHTGTEYSATLWRNDTSGNNYLAVKLKGEPPNTQAVGARITLRVGDRDLMREVTLGSNFLSNNPTDQLFGLGLEDRVETLTIDWPDGSETMQQDLEANQRLTVDHPRL